MPSLPVALETLTLCNDHPRKTRPCASSPPTAAQLQEEALLPLAEVLKNNQCLETLILNYNRIGFSAISAIAFGLRHNQSLDTLILVGNNVGDDGCKSLGEALKMNRHLSQLVLVDNQISDKGAIALTAELGVNTGTSLAGLNLSSNFITDAGAEKLSKASRMSNLTTLLLDQVYL